MTLITDYPSSAPDDYSTYLPLTRRREYLSITDNMLFPYLQDVVTVIDIYKKTNAIIDQASANKVIQSAISSIKQHNMACYLNAEEKKRAFTHLDKLGNDFMMQLKQKALAKEVYIRIKNVLLEWSELIYSENRANVRQSFFQLLPEDFNVVKLTNQDYEKYVSCRGDALCYDFTFYHLNEVNAFPFLFDNDFNWLSFAEDFCHYLNRWDYEKVKIPTAGDLVIYCSNSNGQLKAKHWGIWTTDGKVLSKGGSGAAYKHLIDDVVIAYGEFVYFFHKKVKSPLFQEFLRELEQASTALTHFSHPAIVSPLTAHGCIEKIVQIFEDKKMENIFRRSLFNEEYALQLKSQFFIKIYESKKNLLLTASKIEALHLIKQLIIAISEETLIDI